MDVPGLVREADGNLVSNRNCPSCANQNLKTVLSESIEIDACESCGGLFLDEGEIEELLPKTHEPIRESSYVKEYAAAEGLSWVVWSFFSGC